MPISDQQLHDTIEKIYSTVPGSLPGAHWRSMFKVVDELIPIWGAWLGHSEWWLQEDYREGYQEFYKLPDNFAASYFAVSTEGEKGEGDPLVMKALMASDSNSLRLSEVLPERETRTATDAYQEWGKQFGIFDAVMFHDVFPGTQASILIAFYRNDTTDKDFTPDEHNHLSLLKQHMMAAHRLCLQSLTRRVGVHNNEGYLLVIDALGLIYHKEPGIDEWLTTFGLSLEANRLPQPLLKALANQEPQWKGIAIESEIIGEKGFILLKLREPSRLDCSSLTATERKVEVLLRQGFTIKQVAKELDIAISTAAGHSKRIYAKLGVSGKHELIANDRS